MPESDGAAGADYRRVARSQVDSVQDHCESATAELTALEDRLEAGEGAQSVRAALTGDPTLVETCRSIRTNTFDPLHRQLSKLVVTAPEEASDLSVDRLDDAVAEMDDHHDRLMDAVEALSPHASAEQFGEAAALRAVQRAKQATDHLSSSAELVRCLLAKAVPASFAAGAVESADAFAVTGTVRHGETPLADATVRALDVDLRETQELGTATTDAAGEYRVTYAAADFDAAERSSADVVVRVENEVGEPIGESSVEYNVGREATVDVAIPVDRTVAPTEYARLVSELDPVLDETPLAAVTESGLTFLARELDLDAREAYPAGGDSVVHLHTAAALAKRTPFTEQALYGVAREREGIDGREELATLDGEGLAADLRAAEEAGVVDVERSDLETRLSRGVAALREALDLAARHENRARIRLRDGDQRPLTNYRVRVADPSDETATRTVTTDDAGEASFAFLTDETGAEREFAVTVLNRAGAPIREETVSLTDGAVRELAVDSVAPGAAGTATVDSVQSGTASTLVNAIPLVGGADDESFDAVRKRGLSSTDAPTDAVAAVPRTDLAATRLPDAGVLGGRTVTDALRADDSADSGPTGAGPTPVAAADGANADALATLELTTDLETGATLAERGFENQVAIATTPGSAFRQAVAGDLSPAVADLVRARAVAQTFYLDSRMLERRTALANGHYDWRASGDGVDAAATGGGD